MPLAKTLFDERPSAARWQRLRARLARFSPRKPGWHLVFLALAVTTVLWVWGKAANHAFGDLLPWRGPAQLTILWSITLLAAALVAGSRSQLVEPLFGGLDRAVRVHRVIGPAAILLLLAHVLLLIPLWSGQGGRVLQLFIPFVWPETAAFDVFIVVTWGFFLLGVLAYTRWLSHESWRILHGLNGVLFVVSMPPTLMMPSSVSSFEPLRLWMGILYFAGTLALVYRLFLFRTYGPGYRYLVSRISERGNATFDIVMKPQGERMSYAPGRFIFVSVPDSDIVGPEFHPFSLSSSPVRSEMRLSVRAIGDYTQALVTLPVGQAIDIYGPFGSFSLHGLGRRRHIVCVGAGIGIAPFLGMLAFESTNDEDRQIWLYYVVREAEHAVYDAELRDAAAQAHSSVNYRLWQGNRDGRISAEAIRGGLPDGADYSVMLCGPPGFVTDLTLSFRALGVPASNIVAEGFAFR